MNIRVYVPIEYYIDYTLFDILSLPVLGHNTPIYPDILSHSLAFCNIYIVLYILYLIQVHHNISKQWHIPQNLVAVHNIHIQRHKDPIPFLFYNKDISLYILHGIHHHMIFVQYLLLYLFFFYNTDIVTLFSLGTVSCILWHILLPFDNNSIF